MNNPFARLAGRDLLTCSSRAVLGLSLALSCVAPAYAQTPGNDDTTAPQAKKAADAQTTASTPTEAQGASDIVVTGYRASLDKSAAIKRNSVLIVDSVSAEDIGKLPDVSIADSLARLPGVTAQRLEGRDQSLSIRGLGPEFGTTLLNGRQQVTVGDNRGVEYDQYPSEFFQNVNVYKTANASLIPAGISGTVDLRTLRPLDYDKRVISFQLRGQMNGNKKLNPDSKRFGYRTSATYIDQFAHDTLGVAIGVSATSAPIQYTRYNAWGFPNDANGDLILGGAKPYVQSNVLKRIGAVGTIEYKPNDSWHSTLDVLYTHFSEEQTLRGIEFPLYWGADTNVTVNSASNGFVDSATFSNVHGVQRNDYNQRKADTYALGWNNIFELTDHLKLNVDASWSHADRTDFLLETYTGTGYNRAGPGDTVTVTRNNDGTFDIVPTLNYDDTSIFKITDPQGWGYNGTQAVVQSGFLNRPKFKDDLKELRASLHGDIEGSVLSGWEVGANYSQRKKTSAYTSYFLCPQGGGTDCTVASGTPTSEPVPQGALIDGTTSLDYLGVPAMLTLNPLYLYNNAFNAVYDNRPVSLVRDNSVTEKVWTGYAMLDVDGVVGGKNLKGSIGVQVVHTNQSSDGSFSNLGAGGVVTVIPASDSDSYTNILPSATFALEVAPLTYVKIGASQTMVRARLDQERVNRELTINNANVGTGGGPEYSPFAFSGGNTQLRPYQSTNIDLSLEKYFAGGGYVALAGYFKHLTDYVDANASTTFDFTDYLYLLSPSQQAQVLASGGQIGLNSRPENDGRGYLQGFEFTLSLPFSQISRSIDGFGFFGSASYTDSSIKLGSNPDPITLPGLSDWVFNGSFYYEKHGFQARVNYRHRSSFLGEVAGLSAAPTYRSVRGEGVLDAQIGYEFDSGPLTGLSVMVQGKNLTDQPFVTYQNGDERQVIDYQRYGRQYYLTLSLKM
ncbi:TonB-dependent receptor [Stakelama sediminis]|uniref:Iron complex outermembrane receptor protein n=1 Tax=Stakelama sediminis TaxID=463200 RepID=A0A840Z0J3_9SPHN|nr:TonB-dependent receptor [Stakelama sediminis]MBB5719641.1 iron complex outermembrane receptor protein [Stakelama sediminis]